MKRVKWSLHGHDINVFEITDDTTHQVISICIKRLNNTYMRTKTSLK